MDSGVECLSRAWVHVASVQSSPWDGIYLQGALAWDDKASCCSVSPDRTSTLFQSGSSNVLCRKQEKCLPDEISTEMMMISAPVCFEADMTLKTLMYQSIITCLCVLLCFKLWIITNPLVSLSPVELFSFFLLIVLVLIWCRPTATWRSFVLIHLYCPSVLVEESFLPVKAW